MPMTQTESSGLVLDTHADIEELVEAGMPKPQAETVVRQHARLRSRSWSGAFTWAMSGRFPFDD